MISFNEQLYGMSPLPIVKIETEPRRIKMFGGNRLLIPSAQEIDAIIKQIPKNKLIRSDQMRAYLAKVHDADYTCPVTTGNFMVLSARAAEERGDGTVPYWRALGSEGQLISRYPGGIKRQKERLEQEGFTVVNKGNRYFVSEADKYGFDFPVSD